MVSGFALLAGLLGALLGAAVAWPLWRAGSRGSFVACVLVLAVSTPALYLVIGTPQALEPQQRRAPQSLDEGIARLRQALDEQPQRADGWALLAQSELARGNTTQALQAYEQAVRLAPDDPARPAALAAAEEHLAAGLEHVAGDYMGEHWLATFALLALTA